MHKPDLAKLVTAAELKTRPVYDWFYFPHSFSPTLVDRLVQHWRDDGRGPVQSLLDPFVGAGTTLLAARSLGLTAVGTDLSPLAVRVSEAKLGKYDEQRVNDDVERVVMTARADSRRYKTNDERLTRAFTPAEHANLQRLRRAIHAHGDNGLLLLAFLNVLRETSRAYADGGWFRWVEKPDAWRSVFKEFRRTALRFVQEARHLQHLGTARQEVMLSDARTLNEVQGPFDAVLTSPPYPNRHDYTRVFHLELLLGAGLKNDDVLSLRHTSLRSHVEAKKPDVDADNYVEPEAATRLLEKIAAGGADVRVERMLRGYLEDMYVALLRMHERLAAHGRVALVVSNVRHGGVMFPVDELLVEVAARAGFEWEQTWVARYRGNSAQQMSVYGRDPARESVVLLRK
ncbi:site-specific DNA-methyltransferase [Deinococcus aerius]|uniref:site-specific DNA-methyltransferase n=1 Tax=Deinococcus aerius TaxID=200253 RepID=UPI0013FD914D|nr:site-specific DNA-methyltransferase [Deinococcus aerius]